MAAAPSIVVKQLYSQLEKADKNLATACLRQNFIAKRQAVQAALAAYQHKPDKANAKTLSTTLLSNFATIMVSYTDKSGHPQIKHITNNSMKGSPADPTTHGEQKAWAAIQAWYKAEAPTVTGIAIASDRSPCVDGPKACTVHFSTGDATKVSAANPLAFDPTKNPFIYGLIDFSNSGLLVELLKTDFDFYANIANVLLKDKHNTRYYTNLFAEIQKSEPELYARWTIWLKEGADRPAKVVGKMGASAAAAAGADEPVVAYEGKDSSDRPAAAASSPAPEGMGARFSILANELGALKLNSVASGGDPYVPYLLGDILITPKPQRERRPPRAQRQPDAADDKPRSGPGNGL